MNFFAATLGQLIIVEIFVLTIWLKVFFATVKQKEDTVEYRRLLMTSLGLVLNAISISGMIAFRLYEYAVGLWPFVPGVVIFYVIMSIGNFMFIVSAVIGTDSKMLKIFLSVSVLWYIFVALTNFP